MRPTAKEWASSPLYKLTSLIKDGTHGTHEDVEDGVPLLSAKDVRDGKLEIPQDSRRISEKDYSVIHKNYSIAADDILLTIVGTIGRACQVKGDEPRFTIQRSVAVLRASGIDASYLCQYIRSEPFQRELKDFTNASAQGGIYLGSLAKCSVAHPARPDEQKKIADVLMLVDHAIELSANIVAKQKRIKTGLIFDVLTRGIDENGVLRSQATHHFKRSELGSIPEEWDVKPIGAVVDVIDPNPSHRYPAPMDEGVPIVSTENFIGEDGFDLRACDFVSTSVFDAQSKRCGFAPSDVVFARKGKLGLARPYGSAKKVFSHTVVVMKAKKGSQFCNEFLLWTVRDPSFFSQIDKRMNSNSGVPTLGIRFLSMIPIRVPKPEEQERMAETISMQSLLIRHEEQRLQKLIKVKSALMQDLLTGKRRVTALLEGEPQREKLYA